MTAASVDAASVVNTRPVRFAHALLLRTASAAERRRFGINPVMDAEFIAQLRDGTFRNLATKYGKEMATVMPDIGAELGIDLDDALKAYRMLRSGITS